MFTELGLKVANSLPALEGFFTVTQIIYTEI